MFDFLLGLLYVGVVMAPCIVARIACLQEERPSRVMGPAEPQFWE